MRPQIVITIAARFGRVSWKYSALAYSLILKDVGLLTQTLYLMASDMGLGGCAIGLSNIDLFEKMTGVPFRVEGPVGQFALGRPATQLHASQAACVKCRCHNGAMVENPTALRRSSRPNEAP